MRFSIVAGSVSMTRESSQAGPEADLTRRALLAAGGTVGVVAFAGCMGNDEDAPDPVSLDEGQACDVCGMQIDAHPGPSGQAFYGEGEALPADRDQDEPAYFCSSLCSYDYVFDQEDLGYDPTVLYLTNYSEVDDWEVYEEEDILFITAHLDAEFFADATGLTMVAGSEVLGAMGQSIVGFSGADDAEAFAEEYGGNVVDHDDVSRELVDGLGS